MKPMRIETIVILSLLILNVIIFLIRNYYSDVSLHAKLMKKSEKMSPVERANFLEANE